MKTLGENLFCAAPLVSGNYQKSQHSSFCLHLQNAFFPMSLPLAPSCHAQVSSLTSTY